MNKKSIYSFIISLILSVGFLIYCLVMLTYPGSQSETAVAAPAAHLNLTLEHVTGGLDKPTAIAHTPLPNDGRLFVTQQPGQIRIIDDTGTLLPTSFLNISHKVRLFGESGLLGLAFDPNYAANGRFYVYYTNKNDHNNYLSRFQVTADANVADPASEVILMTIVEPNEGHNGGSLAFGPDGFLYIGVGDGGLRADDDPPPYPQDLTTPLGKILRIDVSQGSGNAPDCGTAHYTIPATNPFVDGAGNLCDEVWAFGLRNPWRISFDRLTGDLFIADVGQKNWEEVNRQQFGSGGVNYGWPCYEGNTVYHVPDCTQPPENYTFPIFTYGHDSNQNCSITGGYIYRGQRYPVMRGHYLLADFCSGQLWSLNETGSGWQDEQYGALAALPSTFGEDSQGEIYIAELNSTNLYHIAENTEQAALTINKTGPSESAANAPIQYDITIQNISNVAAANLIVTDTLPAGANYVSGGSLNNNIVSWQLPTLAANDSIIVSFVVTAAETITNTDYGVTADGGVAAKGETAVTTAILTPQLAIHKTGPTAVNIGAPITYFLTIQNDSSLEVTNLLITDTLPTGAAYIGGGSLSSGVVSWQIPSLAAHISTTVSFVVMAENDVINNDYGVTADGGVTAQGETAVSTTILKPQLTIHKTAPPTAEPGTLITYTLTVQNNGTLTATNVTITDSLPISTTFVSASDSGLPAGGIVTWNIAPLPPNSEKTVTLTVQPINPGEDPLAIGNINYATTANGNIRAAGLPVYTIINGESTFLPIIYKAP